MKQLNKSLLSAAIILQSMDLSAAVLVYTDHDKWLADAYLVADSANAGADFSSHSHTDSFDDNGYIMRPTYNGDPGLSGVYDNGGPLPILAPNDDAFFVGDLTSGTSINLGFQDIDFLTFAFSGTWNTGTSSGLSAVINGAVFDIENKIGSDIGFLGFITTSGYHPEQPDEAPLWAEITGAGYFGLDDIEIVVSNNIVTESDLSAIPIPASGVLFASALLGFFGFFRNTKRNK